MNRRGLQLLIWVLLLAPNLARADVPDACQHAAMQARIEVERLPLPERAAAIRARFAERPELVCRLFDPGAVASAPEVPKDCDRADLSGCSIEGALNVATRAKKDAAWDHYLWAQTIAARLRAAGRLSPAHERLLELWILSATQAR